MEFYNQKNPKDVVRFDSDKGVFTWTCNYKPNTFRTYISADKKSSIDIHWGDDGKSPTAYWN